MTTRRGILGWLGLGISVATLVAVVVCRQETSFVGCRFPLERADRLFDMGVVDANGDGRLDVWTSNHHFRQSLLIADGAGGYRDVLSEWGLDQSREFPMAELSFVAPQANEPGVYIYWLGTNLVVQVTGKAALGRPHGVLEVFDPVSIKKQDGFEVSKQERAVGEVTRTTLEFAADSDASLILTPKGQGLPLTFDFGNSVPVGKIFVGRKKVSPVAARFSLAMQDRHAHAWADFDDDGLLDVFINRGALGGSLRAYPDYVSQTIRDELLVSSGPGEFLEIGEATGIRKNGCSGRHAKWVDFDADGRLDLFVNCYDRENVTGDFPKQLYRQGGDGLLTDVAEEVGLGLPDQQIGNLAWFDVDADGDVDLLGFQDEGVFVYRNEGGRFAQEAVVRRAAQDDARVGHTTESLWLFDGKLSVADFDGDGDLDVFSASKRGNLLLGNEGGRLATRDLKALGLPDASMTGNWVDFDNDGAMDLHLIPQGLYRQTGTGRFERTGVLAVDAEAYRAAICNWFDVDNDGRLDVLMALDENPAKDKVAGRRSTWKVSASRNVGAANNWLQLNLVGVDGNRQAIGARVTVVTAARQQIQEVGASEGSFFSQGHYRLYFGLGGHEHADTVRVRWSNGSETELRSVVGGRIVTVEQKGPEASSPAAMVPSQLQGSR